MNSSLYKPGPKWPHHSINIAKTTSCVAALILLWRDYVLWKGHIMMSYTVSMTGDVREKNWAGAQKHLIKRKKTWVTSTGEGRNKVSMSVRSKNTLWPILPSVIVLNDVHDPQVLDIWHESFQPSWTTLQECVWVCVRFLSSFLLNMMMLSVFPLARTITLTLSRETWHVVNITPCRTDDITGCLVWAASPPLLGLESNPLVLITTLAKPFHSRGWTSPADSKQTHGLLYTEQHHHHQNKKNWKNVIAS